MNKKLLLVKAITLLYRESQLKDSKDRSTQLVRAITDYARPPENVLVLDKEAALIDGLRNCALAMCVDGPGVEYEPVDLIQQIKLVTPEEDENVYNSLKDSIEAQLTESSLKRSCVNIRKMLASFLREEKVKEIIGKASSLAKFQRDKIEDMSEFIAKLISELEPYTTDVKTDDPAVVGTIDFSKRETLVETFENVKKQEDGTSILRTGWKAINRMWRGGLRRGQETVIGALQHNFKTGFTLSLFRHIALYNKPYMYDPTKKPLLLRISFEDELESNMQFLYSSLIENATGRAPTTEEIAKLDPEEIADFVIKGMSVNGYEIMLLRVDPSGWTYLNICNKILELEADGYEIHLLMIDYLNMIPKTGCTAGAQGQDVRDLFRRMRNFCAPRKIALVTPHQISSDAKRMYREGGSDFVKQLPGKGYWDSCTTIDNEVDLETYLHIEKHGGKAYLTVQRGKHRVTGKTDDRYLYTALMFNGNGNILDDINRDDEVACTKVGGGPIGSGNEQPFFCLDNEM